MKGWKDGKTSKILPPIQGPHSVLHMQTEEWEEEQEQSSGRPELCLLLLEEGCI